MCLQYCFSFCLQLSKVIVMFTWIYKKIYFLDVCFSSKFANCKCTHGTKSAKLSALENSLLCSEIIHKKVRDMFLQDF